MTIMIEHLPEAVSKALEERARQEGKSVGDVAAEIISKSIKSEGKSPTKRRDLSDIAGTMSKEDAQAIEETVRWMDTGDLANRQ